MRPKHHALQVKGARNQSLFREVNERVESLSNGWAPAAAVDFICECSDEGCIRRVTIESDDYRAIRSSGAQFFVAPGHVDLRIELVVRKTPTHWVVEKIESARRVAQALSRDERAV